MKILQLSKKFPYPFRDGESIAINALARGLKSYGASLDLLSFNTTKHWVEVSPEVEKVFGHYDRIDWVVLDNQLKPMDMFLNLFSSSSYNVIRFVTDEFKQILIERLVMGQYDVVLVESIYMMPYADTIREYSNAKVVLRTHNVEHEIWERLAENSSKPIYKWYFDYCAKKLKPFELEQMTVADLVVPITLIDDQKLKAKVGIPLHTTVVPVGMLAGPSEYFPNLLNDDAQHQLGFIGSLDWIPNQEGVTWFATEVLPELLMKIPDTQFHVAGRNTPDWIYGNKYEGVTVHGEVECSKSFIANYPIFLVPLFSGSGIRVKILEAMAMGRVVVTTSVGIEGIDAVDGVHYLRADNRQEFIEILLDLFSQPRKMMDLADNARTFVQQNYNPRQLVKDLYDQLLRDCYTSSVDSSKENIY